MEITKEFAELIGIIIGDGNIHYNKKTRNYYIEITGNIEKEKRYYKYISGIYQKILKKSGNLREHDNGLRLRVYDKKFVEFLINKLGMHYNKDKAIYVEIPKQILHKKELLYPCLKGIFDTDGSFFLADKKYRVDYPCIEISTCSIKLSKQIKEKLSSEFRIKIRTEKKEENDRYILALYGENEVEKWFSKIGSSNNYKLEDYNKFALTKD